MKKKLAFIVVFLLLALVSAGWFYFKKQIPNNNNSSKSTGMNNNGKKGMDMSVQDGDIKELDNKLKFLLKPTNEYVVSKIPVVQLQTHKEKIEVKAFGRISYDTRQIGNISARVSGRIEKLYVRYRFQHVNNGQRIMDIYSPEILTDEQNLLFLIKNDPENSSFITAAKEKILLLGISEEQLNKVIAMQKAALTFSVYSSYAGHIHETISQDNNAMATPPGGMNNIALTTEELSLKEGMYVQKGENVFTIFNPVRAWAILNFYTDNQAVIKKGSPVSITPETTPGKSFLANIDYIEPFYEQGSKTVTARVYFDNGSLQIPIGSQVSAIITSTSANTNWLPSDAVVSLGMDKVVFIKQPSGFKAHKVMTGLTYKNSIQILSGLSIRDSVAANAQYLIDSESFIKVNE